MRGTGRVGTDREGALEKSKWGAGGLAKVSFKAKWALDRAQMLIYTHTHTNVQSNIALALYQNQGARVLCKKSKKRRR